MFEQLFPLSQYCVIVDIQTIASEAQNYFLPACCILIHPSCACNWSYAQGTYSLPCVDFTQLTCTV